MESDIFIDFTRKHKLFKTPCTACIIIIFFIVFLILILIFLFMSIILNPEFDYII